MNGLPGRYPRRTVRIDVTQLRRKVRAITERARLDEVVVLRCGKPTWVIVHSAYFDLLNRRARPIVNKWNPGAPKRNWRGYSKCGAKRLRFQHNLIE